MPAPKTAAMWGPKTSKVLTSHYKQMYTDVPIYPGARLRHLSTTEQNKTEKEFKPLAPKGLARVIK